MSAAALLVAFTLLLSTVTSYRLVEKVSGTVSGGDTKVLHTEPGRISSILLLCLDSIEGDADLYVSHSHSRPDYEHHDVSSTTTGIDVLVVSPQAQSRVYMGIYGHVRHNTSSFNLYILSPSEEEVRDHQVWEYNHETQRDQLVIDIDPLLLANDPGLHRTIESMHHGGGTAAGSWIREGAEWALWVLLKLIEFGVEVVL